MQSFEKREEVSTKKSQESKNSQTEYQSQVPVNEDDTLNIDVEQAWTYRWIFLLFCHIIVVISITLILGNVMFPTSDSRGWGTPYYNCWRDCVLNGSEKDVCKISCRGL